MIFLLVHCGHPGNIEHGRVDVSEGTKLGDTAYYACDTGYALNGSSSRTCTPNGTWSGSEPTCVGTLPHYSSYKYVRITYVKDHCRMESHIL